MEGLNDQFGQLPQYEPPEMVWEAVSDQLDWDAAVQELPEYTPPELVWTQIEQGIEPAKNLRIVRFQRWAAAAAVVGVLLVSGFWLSQGREQVEILYATEEVDGALFESDWNADEDGFALVAQFCAKQHFVCQEPLFQALRAELDELSDAKQEIEAAIDMYGKSARFVSQIKTLEQERSELLKELVTMI